MNILVGYATEHGSTHTIAERIGARIRQFGAKADVRSLNDVGTADGYDAFVLGSAVHGQAWLPSAAFFVDTHRKALAESPLWLFSVGMPAALRGPWKGLADKEKPRILADLGQNLYPREHYLFSGVIARDHLPFTGRTMFRAMGCRYGDFRDWTAIEAWADHIAGQLPALAVRS
jgi:menaquinone-dependent protoporphyrinogen oxidase